MNDDLIRPGERLDDLHRNGYKIIQDPNRFCFGQDAVLLAAFARVRKGEQVVDLCSGNGIIPILLCGRYPLSRCIGIEIQAESCDLGVRSVRLNALTDSIQMIQGDINEAASFLKRASFDVVTANPPYMNYGGGIANPDPAKAISRHEITCTLEDVIRTASTLLKQGGRFYMIHRPHRLADIMVHMRAYKLEPKRLQMVHPKAGKEPAMVLVEGSRGGKPQLKVLHPLIVYQEDGTYTKEVYQLYYE